MITHNIIVGREKAPAPSTKRFQGVIGSHDHREFILNRAVTHNPFKVEDFVIYRKRRHQVLDIYSEPEGGGVRWQGLKPYFVEIWGDGEIKLAHPSELKKARK